MVRRPDVRKGLIETLSQQDAPLMQVAVADLLSEVNGPRSRKAIREFLEREELLPPVREHLVTLAGTAGEQKI